MFPHWLSGQSFTSSSSSSSERSLPILLILLVTYITYCHHNNWRRLTWEWNGQKRWKLERASRFKPVFPSYQNTHTQLTRLTNDTPKQPLQPGCLDFQPLPHFHCRSHWMASMFGHAATHLAVSYHIVMSSFSHYRRYFLITIEEGLRHTHWKDDWAFTTTHRHTQASLSVTWASLADIIIHGHVCSVSRRLDIQPEKEAIWWHTTCFLPAFLRDIHPACLAAPSKVRIDRFVIIRRVFIEQIRLGRIDIKAFLSQPSAMENTHAFSHTDRLLEHGKGQG